MASVFFVFSAAPFLNRIHANFFIILLQCGKIFTGLGEFSFLHPLANIPVYKRTLGIHKIKLVIKSGPGFRDRCCVAQHANCALYLGQVAAWDDRRSLVVYSYLGEGIELTS